MVLCILRIFRPTAGRLPTGAVEPLPDEDDQRNESQYKHEVDQRDDRDFWRMMLYPFLPGQQSRAHNSKQKLSRRPKLAPETLARSTGRVPKQMVHDPARDSPMNRTGHPRSVTPIYATWLRWESLCRLIDYFQLKRLRNPR
jgi:hypothetical protein